MSARHILEEPSAVIIRGRKVLNLTEVGTVYRRSIKTITLKIERKTMSPGDRRLRVLMPNDLTEILDAIYALYDDDQEHLVMLVLNGGGDVVGYKLISTGSQDHALADARVIFRNALMLGAAAIIIAHNHPSGNTTPSQHDIDITRQLGQAGELMNVPLLDHVIYTTKKQLSLKNAMPGLFLEP